MDDMRVGIELGDTLLRASQPAHIDLRGDRTVRPDLVSREEGILRDRLMAPKACLAVADVVTLAAVVITLNITKFGDAQTLGTRRTADGALLVAGVLLLALPLLWRQLGLYRLAGGWSITDATRGALVGAGALMMTIFTLIVVFKVHDVSRVYLGSLGAVTAAWIGFSRFGISHLIRNRRAGRSANLRVLMVGGSLGGQRFLGALKAHPELGMDAIGYIGHDVPGIDPAHRLGNIADLRDILAREVVDEVVICLPFEQWATIRDVAQIAEEQGKTVRLPLWMIQDLHTNSRLDKVAGVPMLSLSYTPDHVLLNAVKRGIDILGAVVGLMAFAPVLAVSAVLIRRDGGPVLFRQTRVGRHGRHFQVLKLRTMCTDAEARLGEVAHLNERESITFKATNDPRITSIGRLLRTTSLDEIPQFWNVLVGDMSLVGPRPALSREVEMYDPRHRRRLSVKPGITGLWQISGRGEASFESWVDLDLQYIDGWTPFRDISIMLKTVPAMLRQTGA